ncbi:MAG: hypothetical protein E6L00_02050 [Thaumarchaeota archaeon]|nr:MAG: hypothetical protein E6L00_02050 [Nitrososphaerota archaeon]
MTIGKYFALGLIGLLVYSGISPIWATSDLTVHLNSGGSPEKPSFKYLESAFIEYPNGGKLKNLLTGKNYTISFVENSNNTSVQDLIQQINNALVRDQKSPVIVTDLMVKYTAILTGDDKSASIDYNIELIPTIASYVITKGSGDTPTIMDAAWMGLTIKDPVVIKTAQYGDLEINYPIDFLKKAAPDTYSVIAGTKAEDALKNNLIDASGILEVPLNAWTHLFDPAYTLSETSDYGYKGQKVAISTYTMGQSGLNEGKQQPTQKTLDFSADINYQLTTVQHPSSATVNIDGFAIATKVGDTPAFATTPKSTTTETSSGGFPVGVIYAMAAFGAIVAGAVLFWSNRKIKQAANRPKDTSTSGPTQYEDRQHWADKFDDDKKTPKP